MLVFSNARSMRMRTLTCSQNHTNSCLSYSRQTALAKATVGSVALMREQNARVNYCVPNYLCRKSPDKRSRFESFEDIHVCHQVIDVYQSMQEQEAVSEAVI